MRGMSLRYRRVSFPSEGIQRVDGKIEDSLHTGITMTLSPDGKWMWDGSNWIPAPPQEAPEELIEQPVVETQPEPTAVLPTGFPPAGLPPTTVSANSSPINVTRDTKDSVINNNQHSNAWISKSRYMFLNEVNGFSSDILSDFEAHFSQHDVHLERRKMVEKFMTIYAISGTELMVKIIWTKQSANIVITSFESRWVNIFPPYLLVVLLTKKKKFQNNLLKAKEIAALIDSFVTVIGN